MDSDATDHHDTATRAREEMAYEHYESQFGDERAVSIPAQCRFTDAVTQDTDHFHDALESRGYSPVDHEPDRRQTDDRPHYDGEVCSREHYNRIKVLVFRGGVVRLYPKDEYVPTVDELASLLDALAVGFGSTLEHDPIDDGGEDDG